MPEQPKIIENLMKVTLKLQTSEPAAAEDNGTPYVFIYGVGTSGITPFEKALFGKGVGDRIRLDVTPGAICETLGHLEIPMLEQSGIMAPVSLQITVIDVVRTPDREVVKAMAAEGNCSDCGCGCGGH